MANKVHIPQADIKIALKKYGSLTLLKVSDLMEIFHCSRATAQKLKLLVPAESVRGCYMDTIAAFSALQLDVDQMRRQVKYLSV